MSVASATLTAQTASRREAGAAAEAPLGVDLAIHADGSFDLASGSLALRRARPALDHEPILPLSIEVDARPGHERIRYALAAGAAVELRFTREDGAIRIATTLTGMTPAPHWVLPIAGARIDGADRLYRTGIGFSGPTNIVPLPTMPDGTRPAAFTMATAAAAAQQAHYSFESYLFTGLLAPEGRTLVVSAREVDDFMQKSHVENRLHRHQFRNREVARNAAYFEAGFSTERIPLPDGRLRLPELVVTAARDAWTAMREAAAATGRACSARVQAPSYHYCSCYLRTDHFNRADLGALLDGLERRPEALRTIQLDAGYCPWWGDWLEPNRVRFPDGLAETFRAISAGGHTPGIWVGPYMVSNRSRIAREHPDWLLRWADGTRIVEWRHPMASREGDEEVYVLDTSHPAALDYLVECFRTLRRWGARFFKTDFLEWGWKDSTLVRRHTPGKTSTQYVREAYRAIREAIGEDSYWLGCITYFAPSIGCMDGMRVSSDVGAGWNDNPGFIGNDGCGGGTQNAVEEAYGCQFFNNVLWQNDPDVTLVRDYLIDRSKAESYALALWNGVLGVSINTSDDFHRLAPDRHALWRFLRPQATPWTARLPYLASASPLKVAVRDFPGRSAWAVVLLNDTRAPITQRIPLADLIPRERAAVFAWGPDGARALGERAEWIAEIPGHEATVLYLSGDGAPPPAGLSLGGWLEP